MLGLVNDMWMREVTNIGPAGPDQGRGGRFLFVPSDDLPRFGFHVIRSRTYGLWFLLRGMRTPDGSSADAVARHRQTRIYPLADIDDPPDTVIVNASGRDLDTIHPVDLRFFEDLAGSAMALVHELPQPTGIPIANFWSVVIYDGWTRSMLANGQPTASLNSFADLEANDDGSVTIVFGPEPPPSGESNWIRTVPGKGWFTILRLYGPTDGYFDRSSKPTDITPV
jgi:hypothetical protein